MQFIGAHEARSQFGELLNRVALGETIAITKNGKEVAVLAPAERPETRAEEAFKFFRELKEKLRAEGKLMSRLRASARLAAPLAPGFFCPGALHPKIRP